MKGVPHVRIRSIRQLLAFKGFPVPERDEDVIGFWSLFRPDVYRFLGLPEPGQEGKG